MKRVRVVSDGTVRGTHVYDAETGAEVEYVRRVALTIDAEDDSVSATVWLDRPEVDVTAEVGEPA